MRKEYISSVIIVCENLSFYARKLSLIYFTFRICNFSLFKANRQKQQPDDTSGTFEMMAPEQIRKKLYALKLLHHPNELSKSHETYMSSADIKTEVWAVGSVKG